MQIKRLIAFNAIHAHNGLLRSVRLMTISHAIRFVPQRAALLPCALGIAIGLSLAGCGSSKEKKLATYEPESFASTDTHARNYLANEAQICEAARRALLSQGYQVQEATARQVSGVKSFQPENDVHMEVQLRVVCANDGRAKNSTAFVTALQDRYTLKKVNNSASVGVGVLGSLSLPYSSSEDAMVKVASQTVTDERFYERFYALIDRYLVAQGSEPEPLSSELPTPDAAKKD